MIQPIVEGVGEVEAVPVLLRRLKEYRLLLLALGFAPAHWPAIGPEAP